ncbi:hypothetical protein NBRC111894_443 [Sporolactobacillus inulinus]|uniref:Uncharacterized protein n=1 Tax=Sporolactobacillus inulinus TaxID=2078 RepID=A0A4Y1Z7A1_9BACL|nr:hypothetical protein NBRC111894_443 [Sporolactobacillus inulinus]
MSWPRIKAKVHGRLREQRASETPQIPGLSEEARGAPAASE